MNALISVIIPSYGEPVFLERCIKSVLGQTFSKLELIIVDDNNPDSPERIATEKIVTDASSKDDRIVYVQHECNKNGANARNTGFAIAKGKYISLLDSDDEYMPDRLQKCYNTMETAPLNIAGVYTGCEFRRGGKKYYEVANVKSGNFLVETLACTFGFCTGSNIFMRKTVVDEVNGFDGAFLRHQDYEFLVRVFEKYDLIGIDEVLVVKNNELFNVPNIEKQIAIKKQYLEKFQYILNNLPEDQRAYVYHKQAIAIAESALKRHDNQIASQYYNLARKYQPMSVKEWLRRFHFTAKNKLCK